MPPFQRNYLHEQRAPYSIANPSSIITVPVIPSIKLRPSRIPHHVAWPWHSRAQGETQRCDYRSPRTSPRHGHLYELQTEQMHPSVKIRRRTQQLCRQCTAEQDAGSNRGKITLGQAAKASRTTSSKRKRMKCGCSTEHRSAHSVCFKSRTRTT